MTWQESHAARESITALVRRLKAAEAELAALKAHEPAATSCSDHEPREIGFCKFHAAVKWGANLYAQPKPPNATCVPEEMRLIGDSAFHAGYQHYQAGDVVEIAAGYNFMRGWNACREDMLTAIAAAKEKNN